MNLHLVTTNADSDHSCKRQPEKPHREQAGRRALAYLSPLLCCSGDNVIDNTSPYYTSHSIIIHRYVLLHVANLVYGNLTVPNSG